jgi:hypothetical protein
MSQPSGTAAPTGTSSPDDRASEFRPAPGGEMQSGEKLLVEAYAAIWLIVFVLVMMSMRRLRLIDDRISELEASVARSRQAGRKEPR